MNRRLGILIGSATLAIIVVIALVVVLANHKSSNGATKTATSGSTASATSSASTGSTGSPGAPTGPAGGPTALAPKSGVLFGSSAGTTASQTKAGAVSSLQSSLGVNLAIVHVYAKLDAQINTASNLQFIAEGKTLLISWTGGDTIKMREGQLDATIAKRAQEVAALKVPVFFEFRWEMDGQRPDVKNVVHSPADYIGAWDRMRSVFTAQHVTNAEFVWCPLAGGFTSGVAPSYYPGDDQVDWVCADLYSPLGQSVKSFTTLAQPFLTWAKGHPSKPIMFGEFGADESWGSTGRASWLSAISGVLTANPQIKALVYYNSNAGEGRYSLQSDPKALAALAAVAKAAPAKYK